MVYLVQTADSEVGTPIPDGMTGRIIKGGIIAKAQIAAENLDEIIGNAYILISDMYRKTAIRWIMSIFTGWSFIPLAGTVMLLKAVQSRLSSIGLCLVKKMHCNLHLN